MPNLKQCPHGCTGTPAPLVFTYVDSPRYRAVVTCSACGAAGGPVTGNDEAVVTAEACALWDRRGDSELVAHLKEIEWAGTFEDEDGGCPECYGRKPPSAGIPERWLPEVRATFGHKPGCWLARAIGRGNGGG